MEVPFLLLKEVIFALNSHERNTDRSPSAKYQLADVTCIS